MSDPERWWLRRWPPLAASDPEWRWLRRSRRCTALVRSGVQYNNKTMGIHFGAAHSCSSFADLVIKNSQRFKEKIALNRCTKLHTRPVATGVFFLTRFSIISSKMTPRTQKNGLERRIPRFCTICDKNQPLNEKIEKVMAILVPRWA